MKYKAIVATLFAFALTAGVALAGEGSLCGVVRSHGTPLAGAKVTIDSASQQNVVMTNAKGIYCFSGLHANTHAVRVEKAGYDTMISRGFLPVSQLTLRLNFDTRPGNATIVRLPQKLPAPNVNADQTGSVYIVH